MLVRIVAGLVGVAVVVPTLLWGGVPGVDVLSWMALLVAMYEYERMALADMRPWGLPVLGVFTSLLFASVLYPDLVPFPPFHVLLTTVLASFLLVVATSKSLEGAADRVARMVMGPLYLGGLLCWVPMLRRMDHGIGLVFLLLAATWLGDTGAYFFGRAFGRHRMAPLLSPKKTWEGLLGGLVAAVAGAMLLGSVGLPALSPLLVAFLGLAVDLAGVAGDLAESLLKRSFGVKDSGGIMPGHGGILDRIDSLLFSAPLLYLLVSLLLD